MSSRAVVEAGVRVLTADDLPDVVKVLAVNPIENVFVASRIRTSGVEQFTLGCPVWGFHRDGRLVSICHAGSNLVAVNADADAIEAYARYAGGQRTCYSILGPAAMAMRLWERLSQLWGAPWRNVREVRPHQPVLAITDAPAAPADPRVQRMTLEHWEPYYEAAVRMYTEEIGVSPVQGSSAGYRYYVRQLITTGRAFGIVESGRVIFKADVGSASSSVTQVQGVWLDPELRGRHLAAPAMAGVVQLARQIAPVVSLYVNDFNVAARATYDRVGFRRVGEFATILY